ncbi:MAG: glucosamine-6-phosphate deaminase [Corynebacterium glucuronolyticum]|nr:glucosamine-6-phosphate deaminase [Corynebacterium glucuronolyticum]MDD7586703.1 glucosamine-6-phosphate deaminase [Mycobacteriaceae bacterium]MDY5833352.1 glucosamine-6-phosphate deaminase [Corynebacterium glucuronolyticum]
MEVIIVSNPDQIGSVAADHVESLISAKSNAVLGVATGSSPLGLYAELGRRVSAGKLSLKDASAFMLDEYVGLPADHPERYRTFIERHFVEATDILSANVHGPDGAAEDMEKACAAYEQAIKDAGGVDLQILGVGTDGHIAFNEPGSSLASRTRLKSLMEQTRHDNARFFDDDIDQVPHHCVTQGVGTILDARHLVLLASGKGKAEAIKGVVEGPVTSSCTGSALQMHPKATVIIDEDAASLLDHADYYRFAYANKPDWQRV